MLLYHVPSVGGINRYLRVAIDYLGLLLNFIRYWWGKI